MKNKPTNGITLSGASHKSAANSSCRENVYRPIPTTPLFTLIEMLVVVAIIAILASLLLPALSRTRYMTRLVVCLNNQKEIGLGITMYADDNNEKYPAVTCEYKQSNHFGHRKVGGVDSRSSTTTVKHHDYEPCFNIMDDDDQEYYGGWQAAKSLFECPIAEPIYASMNNYSKIFPYKMSGGDKKYVPYGLFFNWGSKYDSEVSRSMSRIGQTWKLGTGSKVMAASKSMESNILIGDVVQRWSSTAVRANHYEWGVATVGKTGQPGCYLLNVPTNANFLRQDLSGGLSKGLHQLFPSNTGGMNEKYRPIVPLGYLE